MVKSPPYGTMTTVKSPTYPPPPQRLNIDRCISSKSKWHYLPGLVEIQECFLWISHDGLNSVWPSSPCLVQPDKQIYLMQTPCTHPCLSFGGSLPRNHERHTLLPVGKKYVNKIIYCIITIINC